MKKYSLFILIIWGLLLSCVKSSNNTPAPGIFVDVTVKVDLTMTACSGGYLFNRQGKPPLKAAHYQSDSLPVPPGTIIKPTARIRFHPVFTHCSIADTLIVVDEIIF
jgi:hypothetical protein